MGFYAKVHSIKEHERRVKRTYFVFAYVISIDYMTDAEKLWRKSRGVYERYPERFTPEEILK